MNIELTVSIASILIIALVLFWLFYKQSNSTQKLSEHYLLDYLSNNELTDDERTIKEKQLSLLLQKKHQPYSNKILILISLIIIPMSIILYLIYGTPDANDLIQKAKNTQVSTNTPNQNMSMEEAIKQLEQRLVENPDDIDGQMLYARSQVSLQAFDKAVKAYRKANELAPNEPVILTELAEAIALFNNNRSFLGEPESLLKQAVEIDNTNQKALWLYGMIFYEKKDFAKTNELWTNLYGLMENENAKKQLLEQLVDVRTKLGIDTAISTDNNSKGSLELNVIVNYDMDNLPPQTIKRATLFLYAKATSGMPMPIAVIKKPLEVINNSFPMSITLSDLNNLQADRKLSDFDSVIIGARISYSGEATAKSGDLQSNEIEIQLPYSETIELLINQVKD